MPLKQIAKGAEITIGYIDCTMPYPLRQSELQQRYFFDCTCSTCKNGTGGWLDRLKENQIATKASIAVENKAVDLLKSARKDTGSSAPIRKLRYGLHLCYATGVWPLHRYPYNALRNDLILGYLKAQQYHLAFVQAAIRYRKIDPVLMPNARHPIRLQNALVFLELLDNIGLHKQWGIQEEPIHRSDLDLEILDESVMQDISYHIDTVTRRDTFFQTMFKKCERFAYYRSIVPRNKDAEMKEWIKLDEVLDEALAAEAIWEQD